MVLNLARKIIFMKPLRKTPVEVHHFWLLVDVGFHVLFYPKPFQYKFVLFLFSCDAKLHNHNDVIFYFLSYRPYLVHSKWEIPGAISVLFSTYLSFFTFHTVVSEKIGYSVSGLCMVFKLNGLRVYSVLWKIKSLHFETKYRRSQ